MKTLAIITAICLTFTQYSFGGMLRFSDEQSLQIQSNFFHSSLLGNARINPDANYSADVVYDTDTNRASIDSMVWNYSERDVVFSKTYDNIMEEVRINNFQFDGSFRSNVFNELTSTVDGFFAFNFPFSVSNMNLDISGVYSISRFGFSYSIPFTYSINRSPQTGIALINPSTKYAYVAPTFYEFEPSQRALFDGYLGPTRVQSFLMPITVPVSVPEPSFFALLIPLLFILRIVK